MNDAGLVNTVIVFSSESSRGGEKKSSIRRGRAESSVRFFTHKKYYLTWLTEVHFRDHVDPEEVQVLGAENVQAAVVVLARHHPCLPQHLHRRRGAPQPARVAH